MKKEVKWEDVDKSSIFIEDGIIYRTIEGEIKYLKNGDLEINGEVYDSKKMEEFFNKNLK